MAAALFWLAAGTLASFTAHGTNPDTCIEQGGTAYCVGPEVGPFKYQVADPNEFGQGTSQAAATAAYNQQFLINYRPCAYTAANNLPPYPLATPGAGSAQTGSYTQALYYGNGQYSAISWSLSTESGSTIIPIVYSGTYRTGCTSFGPFGVYVNRVRDVQCPGGYTGPYRPNSYTTPTNAYCYRANTVIDPKKNLGAMCPAGGASGCSTINAGHSLIGNPVNPTNGNKFLPETDYIGQGPMPLGFVRFYNGQQWTGPYAPSNAIGMRTALGVNWSSSYDRVIRFQNAVLYPTAYIYRPDGRTLHFKLANGQFVADSDIADRLVQLFDGSGNMTGWKYTIAATDEVETYNSDGILQSIANRNGGIQTLTYDSSGRLSQVSDSFGKTLTFAYNASNQLSTLTDPAGKVYSYAYNTAGNVSSVTYPDSAVRTYVYNESGYTGGSSQPYVLTGVVDENASRFATYQYDSSARVVLSALGGGANQFAFSYAANHTSVTDPLGKIRSFTYATILGVAKNTAIDQPCNQGCSGAGAATTYDTNGNISSRTDFNGNVTNYVYDLTRNLETSRTEAYGTPQARTITTTWDPNWREPDLITEPNRTIGFTYDSMGNALTKTITDTTVTPNVARTWTYTYDSYGRMLTVDGPRTDVTDSTTYAYYTCTTGYQCGQIQTITDALGHVTTFNTYNAHGQPLTVTDPNGVVTTLTYDLRQRLTSRQVGTETTSYTYYPTGLLKQVTLPDGSDVVYTYDAAHRLTTITDGVGNYISYTLDNMGNRTATKTYDPSSTLHRTHTRVFNTLNELYQDVNAAGTSAVTTTYGYDNNGNQTSIAAPLARNTADQYDALNRLKQITDPNSGITVLGYDANDNLASVKDPRNLTTTYAHNGFGDVIQLVSPDTGTTNNTYDSGGNLKTATDARNALATYTYDALNRVNQVAYSDQTIIFTYDTGTNGIGRLTGASDANHSMSWAYDTLGRVTGKGQIVGGVTKSVGYSYTNGDMVTLVTPSGQTVTYTYTNHRVAAISVNSTTILSGVTYDPFGPATGWTWGNSTSVSRTYDQDGNLSQIGTAADPINFGYDNAFRITGITDMGSSANSWTLGYDLLDRITSAAETGATYGWTYDANGNRLSQTGTGASTFTPASTSNRLSSTTGALVRTYGYDAAGNTSSYSSDSFTFNQRGRMSVAVTGSGTTNYVYNALGQLIEKSGPGGTTLIVYDEAGHLLGEYSSSGALIEETVWMGDVPVATLLPNGSSVSVYYVHTDQLNAPRKITRPSDNGLMWRWDADPFGTAAPNQNPSGLGTFVYNLRFPGQYYQAETGLNYNYFRDYDPQTGRYLESDPIGLKGGINPYVYVDSDPLLFGDRTGLTIGEAVADLIQQLFPEPWDKDRCAKIAQKIANLNADIDQRYVDIRANPDNPNPLPQYGPGPNYTTVQGHRRVINKLDRDRRKLEDDYDRHCRGGCPPSPATDPTPNPATTVGAAQTFFTALGGLLIFL